MDSKKKVVIIVDNASTIEEIEVELEKAQGKWMILKDIIHQARKEHLLDFQNASIHRDGERDAKAQKQIMKRANKENKGRWDSDVLLMTWEEELIRYLNNCKQ